MSELRTRILEALARGDGQMLAHFDLGHTAEMMYGKQADAVTLLIGQEVNRFAKDVAAEIRRDAALKHGLPGGRAERRALASAVQDILGAGKAYRHRTQAAYNESPLSKPARRRAPHPRPRPRIAGPVSEKWAAFWWGFTHPFAPHSVVARSPWRKWQLDADGRWTRPLTAREERRYSKRMRHNYQGVRDGRSCNRIFRGFCWRCFWLDITGINRRRRAQYIADFKARADAYSKRVG